jgi:hypothetical protein
MQSFILLLLVAREKFQTLVMKIVYIKSSQKVCEMAPLQFADMTIFLDFYWFSYLNEFGRIFQIKLRFELHVCYSLEQKVR